MSWSDEEFLAEVQRRFGFRLGRFLKVGRRVAYPLSLSRAAQDQRGTLRHRRQCGAGSASGRRDGLQPGAARCRESGGAHRASTADDPGSPALTAAYDEWRAADRREIIGFTDGLVRLFSATLGPVRHLRNLGLLAFDLLPPAKAALSSLSTGAAGRIPKLARGVPLASRRSARHEPRFRRGHRGGGARRVRDGGLAARAPSALAGTRGGGRRTDLPAVLRRAGRRDRPPRPRESRGTCGCSL